MLKETVVTQLLGDKIYQPVKAVGEAFAPSNIALIKYWGKRDESLHLPNNSSVSISLGDKGAKTSISIIDGSKHQVFLNDAPVAETSVFYQKLQQYLDVFKQQLPYTFEIKTTSTVPIAAGVASSACGFAALVLALNDLFHLTDHQDVLSILARLGSGSASRSLWDGFVCWHKGDNADGMDSFAQPVATQWPELMVGLWYIDHQKKSIASREGMQRTVATSALYQVWPGLAETACKAMKQAIAAKDFATVGQLAESNALMMHATMHNATPPVNYWQPESVAAMQQVWAARDDGLRVYFTMDAGPNIKLLALQDDLPQLQQHFPAVEWIEPFKV